MITTDLSSAALRARGTTLVRACTYDLTAALGEPVGTVNADAATGEASRMAEQANVLTRRDSDRMCNATASRCLITIPRGCILKLHAR